MSRFALCLALLCAWTQAARALQLGETKEELLAKHGAPGAEDHAKNLAVYFWEGWSAQLEFKDNVVRKITYRRNYYLQDAEITSLLDSNGGAGHWRETSGPNATARQWSRDDGATATCARVRPVSIVFQAPGLAALYQEGPKIVVPATPSPAATGAAPASAPSSPYAKAPTFPKPLAFVEPDLPVADPPVTLQPPPAATERQVPKLKTEQLEPAVKPAPAPGSERSPAAEPTAAAVPREESHLAGYIIGSFALLVALASAGLYFFRRRPGAGHRSPAQVSLASETGDAPDAVAVADTLRNDQVELLVGEIFRREGYTIELSAGLNSDDGIDLMLRRDSETTLVQCKHWKSGRVTAREVREFYGAMAAGGAPHGIVVTTGIFTPDAVDFVEGKGIVLLDGEAVAAKISAAAKPGENLYNVASWLDDFVARARIFDPECPVCHGTMVIRNNRASGAPVWNCRNYPRCPGRREPRLDLIPSAAPHQGSGSGE